MAGILDFYNPQSMGGILAPQPQMASWQQPVGLFGAALKDVGAYLSGHPSDANSVQSYGQQLNAYNARNQAQQAVQAAQSSDPATRQQGYAAMVGLGLDPSGLQNLNAQQGAGSVFQAIQGGAPISQALSGASPELQAQYLPKIIDSKITASDRLQQAKDLGALDAYSPIAPGDPAYAGYRKGTILGKNQLGDTKVLQQSDIMSPDAEAQKERIARVERSAAIEAQMRMYGINPGGSPSDNPMVKSYVQNILGGNATLQNVPMPLRGAVSMAMQDIGKDQYSPTASRKYTLAAGAITKPYTDQSGYKLTADAVPYLKRIDAAMKTPGSVSDQDLLDSLTKLNTGGNAVTEAQVSLITKGKSLSDWAGTLKNKLGTGGVLSNEQRNEIHEIAGNIYQGYRQTYQPIYDHAAAQLTAANIPKAFWTIPDLNALGDEQMAAGNPAPSPAAPRPSPTPGKLPLKPTGGWGKATVVNP